MLSYWLAACSCSAQVWYFVRFFVCGDFLLPCMPACIPKRLSAVEIFAVSMFICGNSRKAEIIFSARRNHARSFRRLSPPKHLQGRENCGKIEFQTRTRRDPPCGLQRPTWRSRMCATSPAPSARRRNGRRGFSLRRTLRRSPGGSPAGRSTSTFT